jgi:hypothetical protein
MSCFAFHEILSSREASPEHLRGFYWDKAYVGSRKKEVRGRGARGKKGNLDEVLTERFKV